MKLLFKCVLLAGCLSTPLVRAQDLHPRHNRSGLPLTVTVFSESISLPTISKMQKGGVGIKIGTELYYRNRPGSQVFQAVSLGYYHHPRVQNGLFLNSELGYRKYFGGLYADATIGGGAMLLQPMAPSYVRNETGGYQKASSHQIKFMPSLGLGAGYRFRNNTAIFTHYEVFGEMPFSYAVLPHQALHLGARLNFNK
ncbi:hypothetical protein [Telluribacter humicola]|uniref:hypothetical protein n=1 Tax=Telluribacter humicola TaxID=1720261 RepID=UPI001A965B85|nr:hypothetical protein [Telluribacter humicola]